MNNCTPLRREAHLEVKIYKTHQRRTAFGSWDVEKVNALVARSTFPSQNVKKHCMLGPLLKVQMWFCVAGARDFAPCQKWAKHEGFTVFPKTMAGVGHLQRICKDAFRVAGAVQGTCSSEMLEGQGADFLRELAFWSIRSSQFWEDDFAWQVQHFVWPGITVSWQAQHFRQMEWKNRKTHWCEAISSALNFPFLKEVSQNCFVFDVVNLKTEEVSQNRFIFGVVKFKSWGSLAELLRFWCCQVQKMRKSRRINSFVFKLVDR